MRQPMVLAIPRSKTKPPDLINRCRQYTQSRAYFSEVQEVTRDRREKNKRVLIQEHKINTGPAVPFPGKGFKGRTAQNQYRPCCSRAEYCSNSISAEILYFPPVLSVTVIYKISKHCWL